MQSLFHCSVHLDWPCGLLCPKECTYDMPILSLGLKRPHKFLFAHLHLCHHCKNMPRLAKLKEVKYLEQSQVIPITSAEANLDQPIPQTFEKPSQNKQGLLRGTPKDSRCIGSNCLLVKPTEVLWLSITQHYCSSRNSCTIYKQEDRGAKRVTNLPKLISVELAYEMLRRLCRKLDVISI